ncbi:glycoside hydrolase family 44 protein [Streptosporangium sp. NPDC048047]|uniref:glycoside hydrolase family 44 protein n=1 Tax=Streptosporangium sp. NPDC048047 TaxID=3155748 RepID=UPI00342F76D0
MRQRTALLSAAAGVLAAGLALGQLTGLASAAAAGPALSVDLASGRYAINPDIYGMNFADEALARDLRLPVHRWGGNATTRYNFRNDTTNRASDWYFENIPNDNPDPSTLPNGSETDRFVEQNRATGTRTILTLPLIGWVAKDRAKACGFGVAKYGAQESTDPWAPDCGNGKKPDGTLITGNDPKDTSVEAGPQYVKDWITHLKGRYGAAADGGVRYYELDNEPDLWHSTHRDVRSKGLGYDELRDRTYDYAAAVKQADPGAKTLGPVGWGLNSITFSGLDQDTCGRTGCWSNPPDKAAHGGQDLGPWYLDQMKAYEDKNGVRILDYFDNHLYPQQSGVSATDAGDAATQALRLRSTRQLWDSAYVDESWINQPVRMIPRMRELVAQHYPGTKVAMTEYSWGAYGHINGALAEADVLGIFGREKLDLAALWTAPKGTDPVAYAFRMYRNYDGKGGAFGETAVSATSADQGKLAVYAAERASDKALTLVVVNKTGEDLTSDIALKGRTGSSTAQTYRYSAANLTAIQRAADQQVGANGFTGTFPANSISTVVIPKGGAEPTPTPSVTPTATPSATPTVDDTPTPTPTPVASCTVAYTVTNQWQGGFQGSVKVTNNGTTAVNGWKAGWTFADGQKITQSWNGTHAQSGAAVTVTNVSWNGTLAAGGGSAEFGFLASLNGTANAKPTAFTLNGSPCRAG